MKQFIITLILCMAASAVYAQTDSFDIAQQQLSMAADTGNNAVNNNTNVAQVPASAPPDTQALRPNMADFIDDVTIDSLRKNPAGLYIKPNCQSWIYKLSGWLLFISIIISGLYLFATSGICRDDSYDANGKLRPVKERPYSYGRTQLFWWTMIILTCYVAFYALYGNLIPLNMTTVVLLGLGATTFAAGKIIDERQKDGGKGARMQDKNAGKDSFFYDILSDDSGISIHRFQTVIFNVVFGIAFVSYFVTAVCDQLYPFIELNEWQFALLGISSATYLGIKAAENSDAADSGNNTQQEEEATLNRNQD